MALAEASILARFRAWKVFGTGTFSSVRALGKANRCRLTFAFLREAAKVAQVPFSQLVWCLRYEPGEIGGRWHYHWLLGSKFWEVNVGQCFRLNAAWDKMPKCGFSRNHIFNPELNGVEYVTKCLSHVGTIGGDVYESSKFQNDGSTLTLANSLHRAIGGKRVIVAKTGLS